MFFEADTALRLERRRSVRLPIRLKLVISCDKGHRYEPTCTHSLNAYGALVALAAEVVIGQKILIQNPENSAQRDGYVRRVGRQRAGGAEVGIEFAEPAPDFWLIKSVPTDASQPMERAPVTSL